MLFLIESKKIIKALINYNSITALYLGAEVCEFKLHSQCDRRMYCKFMQVLLVMERRAIKKTEEFGSPYLSQARGDGRGSDKNDVRSKLSCPQDLQSLMRSTCLFFLHNMTKKYKNCNIIGIILFLFIYSICYLWFHIQDRDHSLCMDLSDGLQSGAIHGVLVAAILQVIIITDVLHHLVM